MFDFALGLVKVGLMLLALLCALGPFLGGSVSAWQVVACWLLAGLLARASLELWD